MGAKELFKEITRSPIDERMWLIEKTLKSIRKSNFEKSMLARVEELAVDYNTDEELTAFTKLDHEGFYETR